MNHTTASTITPATMTNPAVIPAIPSASRADIGSGTAAPDRSIQIGTVLPASNPSGAVTSPVCVIPKRSFQVACTPTDEPVA